jgi:translation initiation factor 1
MSTGLSRFVESRGFTAKIKVDSSGRKGKVVTVIDGLPKNKLFLEAMTKELKTSCGAGGGFSMDGKDGIVEIQGDQRKRVEAYLTKENIRFK